MSEERVVEETKYQGQSYLCYLGILVLIPLLMVKKEERDEFLNFHLKQGVGLCLTAVAITIITRALGGFIGAFFGLLNIVMLVFMIIGLINVNKKKLAKVPFLGDFYEKLNF